MDRSDLKIIGYPSPSGSRLYRLEQVFKYLNRINGYTAVVSPNGVNDKELVWADIIWPQLTVDPRMIADMWAYQIEKGKILVVDRDDSLYLEKDNAFKKQNDKVNSVPWSKELLRIADIVTVTCQELYDECKEFNDNVVIVPNDVDLELWDGPTYPNESEIKRIGWAGSVTHRDDLDMILPVIKRILNDRNDVKFFYCGDDYLAKDLKDIDPRKHEYVQGVNDPYKWPRLAHTLQLDVGLAPLVDSHFNRCRSYLKYMEYGMCKTAGVYSKVKFSEVITGENGILAETEMDWYGAITLLLDNKKLRVKMGETAYGDVKRNHSIEKHIGRWQHAIDLGIQKRRGSNTKSQYAYPVEDAS
jgi:glycosyltransferase involved in cell wall biosynthesis